MALSAFNPIIRLSVTGISSELALDSDLIADLLGLLWQELQRVDRSAANRKNFEVQMGPRAATCTAHLRDHGPLLNHLPYAHEYSTVVGVAAAGPICVPQFHEVAVAAIVPASHHNLP